MKYLGLPEECASKLGDSPESKDSVFNAICDLFNYLPLAAVVKDSILCVHSGISEGLTLDAIRAIKKPYSPEGNKLVADILWSQPSIYKDDYIGNNYTATYRKLNFTQDLLTKTLADNKLSLLVRSKDSVLQGFERIFNSKVITVFSATNYLGTVGNNGSVLYVKRNMEVQPKVLTLDESIVTWNNKNVSLYPESPKKSINQ